MSRVIITLGTQDKTFKSFTLKDQEKENIKRKKLHNTLHISHDDYGTLYVKGYINIKLNTLTEKGRKKLGLKSEP